MLIYCTERFSAGDFSGQMLQQCMDLLTQRYQPAASNLVMPVSSAYDDKVTPGADTNDRDQMTWRKRMQMVRCWVCKPLAYIYCL